MDAEPSNKKQILAGTAIGALGPMAVTVDAVNANPRKLAIPMVNARTMAAFGHVTLPFPRAKNGSANPTNTKQTEVFGARQAPWCEPE